MHDWYGFKMSDNLTSWARALLEKLLIPHLFKKFPPFYGTIKYSTVFTRVLQFSLFWGRWSSPRLSVLFMVDFHINLRPGPSISCNHTHVMCCSHLAPQLHYLCEGHYKPLTYRIYNQLIQLGAVCWCVLGFRTINPSCPVCSKSCHMLTVY
jgi:hypothetical protein